MSDASSTRDHDTSPQDREAPQDEREDGQGENGGGGDVSPVGAEDAAEPTDGAAGLQEELAELNDRHLRLAAEFNNYRRRQESQMTEAWARAQADLVRRFLDVLDDLQRVSALEIADEAVTVESIVEGIDLVERKFVRTLEEAGGVPVAPEEGDPFDPQTMEAMMRVPAEDDEKDDLVAQRFQAGWLFKGHLVRAARVSVYKA